MAIENIKESEMMASGVSSLPTRPSTPSLYSGRVLSAAELRQAFDKLPRLIADRFNALLEATGLFKAEEKYDRLSELIATELSDGHSLADFFCDVQNGNLAAYMSVDGEQTLLSLLEEIEDRLALPESFASVKEYVDHPHGEVEAGEHLPVSGDAVERRIKEERDPLIALAIKHFPLSLETKGDGDVVTSVTAEGTSLTVRRDLNSRALIEETEQLQKKVSFLEQLAEDQLYSFHEEAVTESKHTVPDGTVGAGALLRAGGGTMPRSYNILNEYALTKASSSFSITYREEDGSYCFNGTLSAGIHPLVGLNIPLRHVAYSFSLFYIDGGVSYEGAPPQAVLLLSGLTSMAKLNMDTVDTDVTSTPAPQYDRVAHFGIYAPATVTFTDYRCRLQLKEGKAADYTPFDARLSPVHPTGFTVYGRNRFCGPHKGEGKGSVTLRAEEPLAAGKYRFSMTVDSTDTSTDQSMLTFHLSDGTRVSVSVARGKVSFTQTLSAPLTAVTLHAGETEGASSDEAVFISDLQAECGSTQHPFLPYHAPVRFSFPESLVYYAESGYGIDCQNGNFIDLEKREKRCSIRHMPLEGKENWVKSADYTFTLSPLPEGASTKKDSYLATGLFDATTSSEYSERLYLTSDGITVHTYRADSLADFLALLCHAPISLLYTVSPTVTPFTEEENAFANTLLFEAEAGGTVEMHTNARENAPVLSTFLYQIKNSEVLT